jgi:hypothetical protein
MCAFDENRFYCSENYKTGTRGGFLLFQKKYTSVFFDDKTFLNKYFTITVKTFFLFRKDVLTASTTSDSQSKATINRIISNGSCLLITVQTELSSMYSQSML